MGCEECDVEHSHDGSLTIRSWQPIKEQLQSVQQPDTITKDVDCMIQLMRDLPEMRLKDNR